MIKKWQRIIGKLLNLMKNAFELFSTFFLETLTFIQFRRKLSSAKEAA
jgi:hypothetical protein